MQRCRGRRTTLRSPGAHWHRRPRPVMLGLVDDRTGSPAALAAALASTGYLADDDLATAAFLALKMHRPLFCEGEPGTGKTALAQALATVLDAELIRLQCHEGIDASQALYDWDFPRQLLHLRALEATGGGRRARTTSRPPSTTGGSCWPGRSCGPCRPPRACCSSTRSTAPTTSSRRSCSRCSPSTPCRSPSWARCAPTSRRSSCSPRTAPARCTTPSSAAASTSGSTTRTSPARSRSCTRRIPGLPERLAAEVAAAVHRAARGGPAQAARRRGVARLGARPAARRRPPPRHRQRGGDARRRAQVPRGRRPRARPGSTPCSPPDRCPSDRRPADPVPSRPRPRAGRVHRRAAPRRPAGHHRAGRRRS